MRTESEESEPEKEPLRFNISSDVPPELNEVIHNIKQVAESILFHWKTFPIVLPPPIAIVQDAENPGRKKPISMRDLFITPSFDELDAVAMDTKGKPRKLNRKQLQSIRETGEFDIESCNFPGQVHVWRLSQLLQKGTERAYETMMNDVAIAVRFIVVTAKNRLVSHFFSVSQSLVSLSQGLLQLLDVFIGIPSLCARDLDMKIREERCKYLVAELVVKPTLEEDLDNLCLFIKQQIMKQKVEKYRIDQEVTPPVPYLFLTPKGIEIDLRLFNKELIRKALVILASILEQEAKGWFLQFREKTIADLKLKKVTETEIERQANLSIMDEYLRRVYGAILSNPDIFCLGPGIGQLLVEHAQSIILMHRAVENVECKLNQSQSELEATLLLRNKVLSRINTWLREKLRIAEEKFKMDHLWAAHEEALHLCREHHLDQNIYFLQRDLAFMKEREPILLQELSRVKIPTRVFHWRTQIWFPHNWVITRVHQGESEIIPTVISKSSTTASSRFDPNEPRYLIEKQVTRTTSSRTYFWRWANYFHRTISWLCNAMFIFGVVIPLCSPVSLRALFSVEPFMPDLDTNSKGALIPRRSSVTQTLCSRLIKLWRHVSKSRTEFETRPDTGFIGKGFTRHLNRLWNYILKGLCGTLFIILVFPLLCLTISLLSLLTALLAPLWVPISTVIFHLVCITIYDFDCPDHTERNRLLLFVETIVCRIFILGCLQPIAAIVIAFVFCPLICLTVLAVAVTRRTFRALWDTILYHAVIKKRGRIPASDSFVAKRIAGPGLESNYYYQVSSEQALAAFEAKLEIDELTAYHDEMVLLIQDPQTNFSNFVKRCFQPFSAALVKEGVYKQLEKEALDIDTTLKEKIERRRQELQTGLNISVRSKIKLTSRELKATIKQAAIMLEKFYPSHVLKRLACSEEEFWEAKGIAFRDWPALAGTMFSEIFSQEFLTPLEDFDTKFRLEVHHLNLFRYAEMLRTAEYRDDLDVVSTVHTPKGNVQVHSPYLDISTFHPMTKKNSTTHHVEKSSIKFPPWKRRHKIYSTDKLVIPLPIPHPAHISVIIYNRENEDPIPQESEQCQAILRAIEDHSNLGYEYVSIDLTPPDTQSLESQFDNEDGGQGDVSAPPPRLRRSTSENGAESVPLGLNEDQRSGSQLSGSIGVILASSEDITLEADGERVTYSHSSYSTTVI